METEALFHSIVGNDEALFVEIMDGAERYRNKEDDRPWFNPANWLKGARWNDQPAKVKPKAQARGNRPAI